MGEGGSGAVNEARVAHELMTAAQLGNRDMRVKGTFFSLSTYICNFHNKKLKAYICVTRLAVRNSDSVGLRRDALLCSEQASQAIPMHHGCAPTGSMWKEGEV